jgi:flagellar basal body-associated protein FliL
MAKKVTLDTLDIEETSVSIHEEPELTKEDAQGPPVRRFSATWLRPVGIAAAVLSCILVFSFWWFLPREQTRRPAVPKAVAPAAQPANPNLQALNGFLIPLTAVKGNQRIVLLDMVFELNDGKQGQFTQNIVRIRSSVYQTVKGKTVDAVVSRGSLELLKGEMVAELERYLGKEMIKNIYFTKYIVL